MDDKITPIENNQLRQVREALYMKQKPFAEKLGITQSYLSAVELGKKDLTAKLNKKLIELFKVSPSWLMQGIGSIFTTDSAHLISDGMHTQSEKTADFDSKKTVTKLLNGRETEVPVEFAHLMHEYGQARSELERQEWRNVDHRLKTAAYNILLMQELSEEVVGTPFDRDFFPGLQKHVATPRLVHKGNGQFANPLNEMSYEEKSQYYADKAALLDESEDTLSKLISDLHKAVFNPAPGLLAPDPREGTIAHLAQDFLKARFEKRWRQKWKE